MLKKLLGGGKKKEFFLELDEASSVPTSEAKVEAPAPEAKVENPAPEAKVEAPAPEVKVETPAPEATTEVVEQPAPAKTTKKTSIKNKAKKAEPKTEIVPTSPTLTNTEATKKEEPKEVGFATKFYMTSTPRRRPGPSLNNFKEIASQMGMRRV
ncbi:hypothetical protein [Crocosphaera sp.]|uniref:hypothetical protein n=1 Tax=Crocosphaera sp. TaxID=2729996 RepID=UPI00261A873E|nr:hypothetical protein [Crocosphaera sp.]MDJ0581399.1 hypothetical protein [Crocosphaera sp.]